MPMYHYQCRGCDYVFREIRTIDARNDLTHCPNCKSLAERSSGTESPSIRGKNYSHPLHSDSLAISPSQIAEHRKLFPNIKIDGEGRPIFKNYRQHDDYLETCGFDKKEQRIKPKGRRIDKSKQPPQRGLPLKEI